MSEKPYITKIVKSETIAYNPNYGDHRICKCEHQYYRHFDSYDDMHPCGCKYCPCMMFEEDPKSNGCIIRKTKTDPTILEEDDYDPGLLNDYGGGDVGWWRDYIRTLINDCNAYWRSVIESYQED